MVNLKKISLLVVGALLLTAGPVWSSQQVPAPYPTGFWVKGQILAGEAPTAANYKVIVYRTDSKPDDAYAFAYTDAQGNYSINLMDDLRLLDSAGNLVAGTYYLGVVKKDNFGVSQQQFTLAAGDLTNGYYNNASNYTLIKDSGIDEPLMILTASLPNGTVGQAYIATLEAGGGNLPYHWSVTGTLPEGLATAEANNKLTISGLPTAASVASLLIKVNDSLNPNPLSASQQFDLVIKAAPTASLTGEVLGLDGKPLANTPITVWINGVSYEVTTDANGIFKVDNVAPGEYTVTIAVNGVGTYTIENVVVAAGQSTNLGSVQTKAGGTLSGTLLDDTGQPLANQTVTIELNGKTYNVKTDSQGYFALDGIPAGTYDNVKISAGGYTTTLSGITISTGQLTDLKKVTLAPAQLPGTGTVSGKVTEKDKPIIGATISIGTREAQTDANGLYTLSNVAIGNQIVHAAASGYFASYQNIIVVESTTTEANFDLTPLPEGKGEIHGYIRDIKGQPLGGARLEIDGTIYYTTEFDGWYQLTIDPGTYSITAKLSGYKDKTHSVTVAKAGYTLSQDFTLELELPDKVGSISGTVVKAGGTTGIAGATVTAGSLTTLTKSDGTFLLENLPIGSYTLHAAASSYKPNSAQVEVKAGETTKATISLDSLAKDQASLFGLVRDNKGQSLSGAKVAVGSQTTSTNTEGWYQLAVDPGVVTLTVSLTGYQSTSESLHLQKGEAKQVDFILAKDPTTLTGAIEGKVKVKGTTTGIAGASVTAGSLTAKTDANGNYQLQDVPVGDYFLRATAIGYVPYQKQISVSENQTTFVDLELSALSAETAVIYGYVLDDTGKKIDNAKVQAKGVSSTPYAVSAPDGWYQLTVSPGTYTLTTGLPGYKDASAEVTVKAGESVQVDLVLELKTEKEPVPTVKIWFGKRAYQKTLVEKGQKFVVPNKPDINIDVSIDKPYTVSVNPSDFTITIDPGTSNSKTIPLTSKNIVKKVLAAGAEENEQVQAFTLQYTVDEEMTEGAHVISVSAKSSGAMGIASTVTESASVEVMGGPLRMVGIPLTFPSPFSISRDKIVTVQYDLSANANIDIYLTGVSGLRVKKFVLNSGSDGGTAGINKVTWDGTTDQGYLAGNAIYVGTIISRDEGKLLGKFKLTIVD